jgi:hypothetical protein
MPAVGRERTRPVKNALDCKYVSFARRADTRRS